MNRFINTKRLKSCLAETLAAVILISSLTGCQSQTAILRSQSESSSASTVQNQTSSEAVSSKTSAASSSAVSSSKASSSQKASSSKATSKAASSAVVKAAQKVQPKTPTKNVQVGNTAIQKVAIDQQTQTSTRLSVTQSTASTAAYSYMDQRSGYSYLSDSISRSLYSQMLASVYKVTATPNSYGYYPTERITVNSHLSESQLRIALLAFLNDNPQVFWLARVYSYGYSGNSTYIQFYSYVSQTECNAMIQQLNSRVTSLIQGMPSGLSEFDREYYLFDFLVKKCTYDTQAVSDDSRWKSFTSYGAIVEGSVVCEGYARAMQLLSSYAGLQCILVTGQSDGVNHMWNLMKIDGSWYHLDITWSDSNPTIYNYFNVTDAVIRLDHTISPNASSLTDAQISGADGSATECNLALPTCTATKANYFNVRGIPITSLSDNTIVQAIAATLKQKQESVSFHVEVNENYNTVLNKMINWLSSSISESGVSVRGIKYITDEPDSGITVFVSYL